MNIRIISSNYIVDNSVKAKTLVIAHLYYLNDMETYLSYLENIPEFCDVLLTASSKEHREKLEEIANSHRNWRVIDKKNQGRDISALLVAAKPYIKNYEYICFVHDKKANCQRLEEDVKSWTKDMWDSVLYSSKYILNILAEFQQNPKLGLLLPEAPQGNYYGSRLGDAWLKNFENTYLLAEELGLSVKPQKDHRDIAIGTVLWARVSVLEKLFQKDWKYEDFPTEPMEVDGTISHAVERIFTYLCEDAGYEAVYVIDVNRMESRYKNLEKLARDMAELLYGKGLGVNNEDILSFEEKTNKLQQFVIKHKNIYIYGAGQYAVRCVRLLKICGLKPQGVFTTKDNDLEYLEEIPVTSWKKDSITRQDGLIIAVRQELQNESIEYVYQSNPQIKETQIYKWE